MASVSLRGVKKSYGPVAVIHGIDLEIADGEFIVIVGPSGCGKSTVLRMIAGLEQITAGEIAIGERVVNRLEPKDRDIAMVFQNYALYPHMSVYDNMAYGLRNRGMKKADIDARVRRAAAILQLEELLQRRPRQLSGGQRQRVAMGRAIVREPAVFLFDEPLSNLDAKLRVQMRLEIRKLHRDLGVTSIYVTHDQTEAMTLADRLVVMNAGIAEQIGRPKDVYDRPATAYVAGFIGSPSMNFLPVRVEARALRLADGSTLATTNGAVTALDGRAVTLGIRPENLRLAEERDAATWRLRVDVAEALGADTLIHGRIGDADLVIRLPGHVVARPGETLPVLPDGAALHLFDPASGRRIDG
ncbi:MAG: sn-glycerol-3-phosphate import ATP-binding protein UgpC [Rhodospirillales bacterium]